MTNTQFTAALKKINQARRDIKKEYNKDQNITHVQTKANPNINLQKSMKRWLLLATISRPTKISPKKA
jgi:hypothetical protein